MIIRIIAIITAVLASLIPEFAIAAGLIHPLCSAIPGCGMGPRNVILEGVIPEAARIMLNASAALSVVFVVIGGARFLISFGRDEEFTKAKNTIQWALIGIVVAVTSHRIVIAVISENYGPSITGDPLIDFFASVIRIITGLLNAVFLIMVIASGTRMVMARGKEDEVTKGKYGVLYAITGAIIINVAPFVVRAVLQI